MTVREAISSLISGISLAETEMAGVMAEIMDGQATPAQIGAFLTALRLKGETVAEISGAARVIREKAVRVQVEEEVVDTCGTGGDGKSTFNISTTAAFVVAGAGVRVAKHGNRAMSGAVGGADVLEALSAKIELSPEQVKICITQAGFGFLLAPAFHRAMRHAVGPRREIGIRTIFNLLGPLTNPAGARHQLIGVFDRVWVAPLAEALGRLGSVHALVVHGEDGLDEITLTAETHLAELREGKICAYTVRPEDIGLHRCTLADLQIGGVKEAAEVLTRILKGERGPCRDIVLLNAAAALYAGDSVPSLSTGIAKAAASIDSGAAYERLNRFVELTNTLSTLVSGLEVNRDS
jgi:anthranilate phosphoribosyltransferase